MSSRDPWVKALACTLARALICTPVRAGTHTQLARMHAQTNRIAHTITHTSAIYTHINTHTRAQAHTHIQNKSR
jgi:hypothetical protein